MRIIWLTDGSCEWVFDNLILAHRCRRGPSTPTRRVANKSVSASCLSKRGGHGSPPSRGRRTFTLVLAQPAGQRLNVYVFRFPSTSAVSFSFPSTTSRYSV